MNIGVLLLTQENIGTALLRAVQNVVDPLPFNTSVLAVNAEASVDVFVHAVRQRIRSLDAGAGVLILVDAAGLAPEALATAAETGIATRIVAGLNLPMLLGLFKNPKRDLDELAALAVQSARQGVFDMSRGHHAQSPSHPR